MELQDTVETLLLVAGVYIALGLLFAVAFLTKGVRTIDPSAEQGTRGFRLLILPGVVWLWPVLLRRWMSGSPPREERNAHRRAARTKSGGAA